MNRSFFAEMKFAANEKVVRVLLVALLALVLCPLSAFAQCTATWNGGTGSWDVAGNWTPSGVPTSSSNTCINAANSAVTINASDSTDNLTLGSSTDTLTIGNSQELTIAAGGNISNVGNIMMGATANNTFLIIDGATTLSGGGTLTMSNTSNINYIEGGSGTLTNEETIQGSGSIGNSALTLVNSGSSAVIDANNSANQLVIDAQSGAKNSNGGTMEATAGGLLNIDGYTVANTGGTLFATGTNSVVLLNGTSVTGGTLTSTLGGTIQVDGTSSITGLTISGGSTLQINNAQTLALGAGTITNNGNISVNGTGNNTFMTIAGATTLAGTGTVTLSDTNNINYVQGAGTLTNQETIQGSGTIGNSALTLINSGTIDADNSNFELLINPQGGTTNNGTLEATAGGTLELRSYPVTNNATILATGTNSVVLLNGMAVTGGTLTSTLGGTIQVDGTSSITGLTISGGSTLQVNNAQTLQFGAGTITNNGNIILNGTANNTFITLSGGTTLAGAGTLTMSSTNNINFIEGSGTLTNQETIQGSGTIGNSALTLINSGTIDADNSANELVINAQSGTTNTKTLEATAGATLQLQTYAVTNTGGTILASGTGSVVLLNSGSITGGTLTSAAGGLIEQEGTTTLNTLTLSTGSNLDILNAQTLDFGAGTITNNGNILLDGTANNTFLIVNGATTLAGTGTLTMSKTNDINYIQGSGTLTNQETIQGSGTIGNSALALVNSATIDADNSADELLINPQSGTTNTKTLEATAGGTLELRSYPVNNASGTILATGTGSVVLLNASAITGGTLTSSSGGVIDAEGSATLDALTISSGTSVDLLNSQTLTLVGTITNKGTINVGGTSNNTFLDINGNVTLTAPGKVILSASSANYIEGSGTLTNQGTIEGEGNIGNGQIGLINSGSILANETKKGTTPSTLVINTSSVGFTNNVGTKNGILNVSAKNTVIIEGGPLNNFSSGTLTGGEYLVAGELEFAAGSGIVTNDATITLTGATAEILNTSNNTNALTGSFADNGTKGVFTVNSATFNDANVFTNSGTLAAGAGGKFNASNQLTNFNSTTSTLTGGAYTLTTTGQLEFNNQGDSSDIVTNDAIITLAGVDTTKSSFIDQAGANALANFTTNGSSGSLLLTTDRNFITPSNFTNAGIVDVEKSTGTGHTQLTVTGNYTQTGGTTTVDALLTTSGAINIQGGFVYGNAGTVAGAATLTGALNLTGGTINPGDGLKKIGVLNVSGSYTESGAGILNIDLDGTTADTKYDVLNVSGAATLGGTLDVDTLTGFTLAAGDSFDVLSYASETGTFATLNLPTLTGGDTWNVNYAGNSGTELILTVEGPAVSKGTATATPAHRVSRAFGDASAASTHEPTAILSRVTCSAARMIGSACGDKASVATASHDGEMHEVASAHTELNSAHNNVMVATRSISSARGGASHETSASASAMARLYVCAYLPSTVGHTMGCN